MLTIGYIGNGKSTNRYHLPFVLQRKQRLHVKTIYERNPDHRAWDTIEGVHYTSDLNELLEDKEIDLIVVCTMQNSHYDYAKLVLQHDKHVLVEKPFMMTLAQAQEIFALAKEKGKIAECYQNRRYDSDFLTTQSVIESGKLGELYEMEMHFDYYRPQAVYNSTYSRYEGFLYGHACHTLDQVISYFGIPDNVDYQVKCLCGKGKMNDYFDLDLFYGESLKISVKSSFFRVKSRPSFVAYGKKGMFVKETKDLQETDLKKFYLPDHEDFGIDSFHEYGVLTYADEHEQLHEEKIASVRGDYGRVYDALYDAIVLGKERVVKEEQTLAVMEILEKGSALCEERYAEGNTIL